jgi:hypothetical protein
MPTIAAATPGANIIALAWLIGIPASAAVVSNTATIDLLTIEGPPMQESQTTADTAVSVRKHRRLSIDPHQHRTRCPMNSAAEKY